VDYPGNPLERLKETMKNLNQVSQALLPFIRGAVVDVVTH